MPTAAQVAMITTLASFSGPDGMNPYSGLATDSSGDLFGTTSDDQASHGGTVFEIAKTASGYASAPITLARFNGANGAFPLGGLIVDGNGDLFGTTEGGGADGQGTAFEIPKTASGYASVPTTLVSFTLANGAVPFAGLTADANGTCSARPPKRAARAGAAPCSRSSRPNPATPARLSRWPASTAPAATVPTPP